MKMEKPSRPPRYDDADYSKKKNPFRNLKTIRGYADIQHFYKSALKYSRNMEKDSSVSYELGYN